MWNFDRSTRFSGSQRRIEPEVLDEQTPGAGARSLRDLVRINRYLGGHEATRKAFAELGPKGPFTVLDVGAASGDTGRAIHERYPVARVTSLDYKLHHLTGGGERVAADAFKLPFRPRSFDFVHSSLFLHHFKDPNVTELLLRFREVARVAVVVNDLERHILPYYFLPATRWIFRWDPITLHDGPVSVQAAFREQELVNLAKNAGFREIVTRVYRPAFRIVLIGRA